MADVDRVEGADEPETAVEAAGAQATNRLNIGGWLQPRFEYRGISSGPDASGFTLRRVRLDFTGQVLDENLTFRIMSEHARTSNLRDAWINYAFSPTTQVRVGQFNVPFQWHRFIGPTRQHFAERGMPSETFGFPNGRDIGVMVHGRNPANTFTYGAGFFDGSGRNVAIVEGTGHMVSARGTWALQGTVPREDSDYAFSETPGLTLGAGVQAAWKSDVRDWDLGASATGDNQADWVSGTADVSFRRRGFSVVVDGYLRRVTPNDPLVGAYTGSAYMVSAGYFIAPKQYEVVARWSQSHLDRDDPETSRDEWGLGLNIYHRGHDWKTRINYLNDRMFGGTTGTFLVEFHLQF
jgi:hypothetical protein